MEVVSFPKELNAFFGRGGEADKLILYLHLFSIDLLIEILPFS